MPSWRTRRYVRRLPWGSARTTRAEAEADCEVLAAQHSKAVLRLPRERRPSVIYRAEEEDRFGWFAVPGVRGEDGEWQNTVYWLGDLRDSRRKRFARNAWGWAFSLAALAGWMGAVVALGHEAESGDMFLAWFGAGGIAASPLFAALWLRARDDSDAAGSVLAIGGMAAVLTLLVVAGATFS